ncbi:MAG: hypothetical protein Q4C47_02380, partial [Planctomycetia bacterium]|nr:hypothetical protein [Planctomycetia bacterium]
MTGNLIPCANEAPRTDGRSMMAYVVPLILIAVGLTVLVWSAGRFVDGAVLLAQLLKVPAIIIGMVIVGLGTSAPELFVSVQAAVHGNPAIAIGNAFGSNIANIAVILGVTALLVPITVRSRIVLREIPILLVMTLLALGLLLDGVFSRTD